MAASKQENARCGAPPRPCSCVSSPLAHSSLAPPPPVLRLSESPPTLCARSRLTVGVGCAAGCSEAGRQPPPTAVSFLFCSGRLRPRLRDCTPRYLRPPLPACDSLSLSDGQHLVWLLSMDVAPALRRGRTVRDHICCSRCRPPFRLAGRWRRCSRSSCIATRSSSSRFGALWRSSSCSWRPARIRTGPARRRGRTVAR